MLSTTYYRFPDGTLPNPADSGAIGRAPDARFMSQLYRVLPTAPGLAVAASQRDWDALIDPPPAAPSKVAPPAVASRSLETTRMALLKQGNWQLFFHYGQLTRSHSQSEALNFSAAYGTTDISHDAGTVGYGSPMYHGYYGRGLAQNVLLVDGEGQDLEAGAERTAGKERSNSVESNRGELLSFSSKPARVSAAQKQYRKNVRAQRTLAIEGENTLIDTAQIETSDGGIHRLGLVLHFQGSVEIPPTFQADPDLAKDRPEPFRYWQNASRAAYRDRAELKVSYGKLVLHVTILCPGEFTLWRASSPDIPPHRRDSLYVETSGTAATFTTTFTPAE
jgi:hypothetical protein